MLRSFKNPFCSKQRSWRPNFHLLKKVYRKAYWNLFMFSKMNQRQYFGFEISKWRFLGRYFEDCHRFLIESRFQPLKLKFLFWEEAKPMWHGESKCQDRGFVGHFVQISHRILYLETRNLNFAMTNYDIFAKLFLYTTVGKPILNGIQTYEKTEFPPQSPYSRLEDNLKWVKSAEPAKVMENKTKLRIVVMILIIATHLCCKP